MEGLKVYFNIGHKEDRKNPNILSEYEVLQEWADILEKRYNHKMVIVNNSTDYSTLQPEGCLDLLRLKYGGAKWVKLFIPSTIKKLLINDSRFDAETKKTCLYWKSTLKDTDISKYFDVLDESFNWLKENN